MSFKTGVSNKKPIKIKIPPKKNKACDGTCERKRAKPKTNKIVPNKNSIDPYPING